MRKVLLAVMVLLVATVPALAQDRPVGFNLGGGWSFPVSGLNDAFDTGWNGAIGVTLNITPTIGFQTEYMYNRLGGPDRNITVFPTPTDPNGTQQLIESNHQVHNLSFNAVFTPLGASGDSRPVGAYFLGGGGYYHRKIQLTSPSVGYTSVCDPYWYVCYPTLVEVDRILGDRSSNDFGINLGAGITFGTDAKFYVETRWHYVWGPTVTNSNALPATGTGNEFCQQGCSTNASYWPVTFGVRW